MKSRVPYLFVGMLSLVLSRLAGAQDYQWTEIVIPGATVRNVFGLNDKGQTAVTTTDGRTGIYGDGTFTPLPPPPQGFRVVAFGINDDGVITGSAFPGGRDQGFILRGSTYTLFSRPGWDNTDPRAIANSALITGQTPAQRSARLRGSSTIPTPTPSPTLRLLDRTSPLRRE